MAHIISKDKESKPSEEHQSEEHQEMTNLAPTQMQPNNEVRRPPLQNNIKLILAIIISVILIISLIATFINPKASNDSKLEASLQTLYKLTAILNHANIGALAYDNEIHENFTQT